MAAGTKTKFLVAFLLMVNAFVLINIRRLTPYLPGGATTIEAAEVRRREEKESHSAGVVEPPPDPTPHDEFTEDSKDKPWDAEEKVVLPSSVTNTVAQGGVPKQDSGYVDVGGGGARGHSEGEEPMDDRGHRDDGDVVDFGHMGSPKEVFSPAGGGGGGAEGEGRRPGGGADGRENSGLSADERECRAMLKAFKILPGVDWGLAGKKSQRRWALLECDNLVQGGGDGGATRAPPQDCTARPSLPTDPLIAVCAGSTTRGVDHPDENSLALFRFLLPSLGRTADCGFNYLAVIGYDEGDIFFDSTAGRKKVKEWFEMEVSTPGSLRGINLQIELVRVPNDIKKPGPVFTATTKVAYKKGANYIYRVNDDSEMMDPWSRKFVNTLEAMGPPYGVVGPESQNKNILVHDFTHRLHMDIFKGQYYPATFTDWYVDDWISRVYGNDRTVRAKNCKVEHHTGAHGQRYTADKSKATSLKRLIQDGASRIASWAIDNDFDDAARQILHDPLDGKSAKREAAKIIS